MSSNPRRPFPSWSIAPIRPAVVAAIVTVLALVAPEFQLAGVAAGQYILSGSPNGTGTILVDDKLEIFLNGQPVYADAVAGRGTRPPITFTADVGDQLRFVVNDTTLPLSGACPGLSTIYLVDPQGKSAVATPGFYIDCPDVPEGATAPGPGQGLVFDATFTIPDIAVTGSLYKEVSLPGSAWAGPLLLNGSLYGVTYDGGNGGGTIFRASPDLSQVTTLYSFPGTGQAGQAGVPYAELTPGGKGFFGTTSMSVNGGGAIFEFDISTNTISYLVDVPGFENSLDTPLLLIGDYLYGSSGSRIFRVHTDGTGFEILHEFDGSDGRNPGGLTLGPDGFLYGTAIFGGSFTCDPNFGCGTVFRLRPDGQDFSVLHVFNKSPFNGDVFADRYPQRRLVLGSDNRLYGTTYRGVFSLAPAAAPADFTFIHSLGNMDGSQIFAPPAEGGDGRIYVVQYDGGIEGFGAVYSMTKSGGNVVMHHQFGRNRQGYLPYGQLALDTAGTIYGTTEYSDATPDYGRVFSIRTSTNQAPIANATAPANVTADATCLAGVTLDGSGSSDPDGGSLTYAWSENGTPLASGATPTVQLGVGTHTLRLTVTDPQGASAFGEVTVTVASMIQLAYIGPTSLQSGGNSVVQVAVLDGATPVVGAAVDITVNGVTAQATTDQNGMASVTVGPQAGTAAAVRIDYAGAACGGVTKTVAVPVNGWPTAIASASSPNVAGATCTAQVTLDGSGSTDPNIETLTYAWSENGIALAIGANPTVALSAGTHQVTLTVTDPRGGSGTTTIPVVVGPQPSLIQYNGPTQFSSGVAMQVSATLTSNTNQPIAGASVRFAIALDGIEVFATTDANGLATTTITPPGSGSRTLAVGYFGSACHESIGVNVPVNVVAQTATLNVVTQVVNNNGGTLTPADFTNTVVATSPNPSTFPGSAQGVQVTLVAGSYQVVQAPRPEYVMTMSGDCATSIAVGVTKTCTITNDDRQTTLTLNKQVVNDSGGTLQASAWTLRANGTPFSQGQATPVTPGQYPLDEIGPGGYTATAWNCVGGSLTGSTLTIASNTEVSCTIANDDQPATLTLSKNVINDNGGTATASSWQLTAGAAVFVSGVSQPINAGIYTLAESGGPPEYAAGTWSCQGGGLNGNQLTLAPGDTASCSITNNDLPGTLNVVVQIITNNGGPAATPANVTVTVTGNAPSPASFAGSTATLVTLNAGSYSVAASQLTGYSFSATADCAGSMTLGGSKTCTLTFDDDAPSQQQAPTANSQGVQTNEDTAVNVTLTATDPNNDPLTFIVVAPPTHGTLSGTLPDLVYTPAANYNGPDSFTFKANDGSADSNIATVTITVLALNDRPTATAGLLTTPEDTAAALTLTGFDADGDPLTFTIETAPQHGTLSGNAPNLTYTPDPNYSGPDSVAFTASDGTLTSLPASISISVSAVNDVPSATPQTLTTPENTPLPITLSGTDPDNATLTFAIATGPAHGVIHGTGASITYVPTANYVGPDSFIFTVSDGAATSIPAAITISVTNANSAPVAIANGVSTPVGTPLAITLTGSDADNDPLTFAIVAPPTHGTLTGTAPGVTYTPTAGYTGSDSFTFRVNDGTIDSAPAAISIDVTPVSANLALTLTDNPDPVIVGQALTYLIRVRNNGPDLALNTTVTVSLPAGLTNVNAPGCSSTNPLTCVAGPVAPNTERPFTITAVPINSGQILTTASASSAATDADPNDNSATIGTFVAKSPTTTTLFTAPTPSTFGQVVTLTASVVGYGPSGTVAFFDGGAAIGSATLSNGSASITISTLPTGTRSLTAQYAGDGNNDPGTSSVVSHVVQPVTSSTTLTSSVNPSTAGQNVTFTVIVTGASPTGSVTFAVDGVDQATVPLGGNASAAFSISSLSAATHSVTARYSGDTNNTPSTSPSIAQQVGKAATSVTLIARPNPAAPGTMVDLIATVTGANPTGSVTFMEGNQVLGSAPIDVSTGTATLPISQGKKGSRQLTASYPGDGNNLASTSPRVRLTTK